MKRFNNNILSLCIAMALSSASTSTFAAQETDVDQLLNQGHFWFEQGRPDFSEDAWRKVLLIDPGNTEALGGLEELNAANLDGIDQTALAQARSAANQGNHQQALEHYKQAFATSAGTPPSSYLAAEYYLAMSGSSADWQMAHKHLKQLSQKYPSSKRYQYSLATAMTYQEITRIDGIKALHQLRSDKNIGSDADRAWHQAVNWLGASDDNWISVHNELSDLHQRYPDTVEYTFPLAKLKSYRESTRREAINMLSSLMGNPKYATDAAQAWRQTLLWMNGTHSDRPLYSAFLERSPEDSEVSSKMNSLPAAPLTEEEIALANEHNKLEQLRARRAEQRTKRGRAKATHGRKITQGYELLNQQLPESAINQFERLLSSNSTDSEALKGLGIAHMRLQNFGEAERYLSLAIEANPTRHVDLQTQLEEVRFWSTYNDASWAFKQGETEKALDLAQQATSMRPGHADTLLLLGHLAAGQKDNENAKQYYEQVLLINPNNTEAQQGLAGSLAGMGLMEQAGRLIHKYQLPDTEYLSYRNRVEAAALRAEAGETNNNEEAIRLLTRAQRLQQQDPWVRLDLARHYRTAGRPEIAISLLDQLINTYPDYPDAYHAKALYHAQFNELFEGLVALESIPEAYRNQRQASLYREVYRQLWIKQKKLEADQLTAIGDYAAVREIIESMKIVEQADPSAMLVRAELLADIGEYKQAVNVVNQVKKLSTPEDIAFKTQLATVLLKARERGAMEVILVELEAQKSSMSFAQQDDLHRLKLGMSLQKSDDQRKQGRYEEALATLEPMRKRFKNHLGLKLSRATIFKEKGDFSESQNLYRKILIADPNYRAAYAGSAGSYMDQARFKEARKVVDKGLRTVLEAPELLALRGKLKLLKGDYNGAAQDLQQSLFDDQDNQTYNLQNGAGGGIGFSTPRVGTWQHEARLDLRRLNNRILNNTLFGAAMRNRDGDAGVNQLNEIALPILIKNYRDYENMSGLSVVPVSLDAGTAEPQTGAPNRIGALVLARESDDPRERDPVINNSYSFDEAGVALSGFIRGKNYELDLGVTPVGFKINTVLAGLHWKHQSYRSKFNASLTRRAVKDSLLSYAGMQDPDTQQEWGAVAKTGVDLDFEYGQPELGVYASVGAHVYDGQEVADNDSTSAQAGVYFTLFNNDTSRMTAGLNANWASYDKNLNFFTLGHGGYFSPQDYLNVSIPLEFQSIHGKFSYRLGADLGQQDYTADAIDVFPIDQAFQDRLEVLQSTVNSNLRTQYDAEDKSDFVYNLHAEFEYALGKKFALGGWTSGTSVNDFEEFQVGIFLRRYALPRTDLAPLFRDDIDDRLHELW